MDCKFLHRCDCQPGFLYVPGLQSCFAAFQQGPCDTGKILVNAGDNRSPICVKNECDQRKVMFNGQCHELDKGFGCQNYKKFTFRKLTLTGWENNFKLKKFPKFLSSTVDATTFELACMDESEEIVCKNKCCRTKEGKLQCIP